MYFLLWFLAGRVIDAEPPEVVAEIVVTGVFDIDLGGSELVSDRFHGLLVLHRHSLTYVGGYLQAAYRVRKYLISKLLLSPRIVYFLPPLASNLPKNFWKVDLYLWHGGSIFRFVLCPWPLKTRRFLVLAECRIAFRSKSHPETKCHILKCKAFWIRFEATCNQASLSFIKLT